VEINSPALHQRERTVAPRENDVRRHHADDARIVPVIAGKAGIRTAAAIGESGPGVPGDATL
jgi:hypothetical protein